MEKPFVILNAAMTLDGKIATKTGESKISNEADLLEVHRLRSQVDAIMVGINTVLVDDPILNVRFIDVDTHPTRVITDSLARIPNESRIVQSAREIKTYLAVSDSVDRQRITELENQGIICLVCGEKRGIDLDLLMKNLDNRGVKKLMLEGGSLLNWSMLSEGLVDEIRLTIAPIIVGGSDATSLVSGEGFIEMKSGIKLELMSVGTFSDYLRIHYKVQKK